MHDEKIDFELLLNEFKNRNKYIHIYISNYTTTTFFF